MAKPISRVLLLVCGLSWACSGTVALGGGAQTGGGVEAPPALEQSEWRSPKAGPQGPLLIHTDPGDLPRLELATDASKKLSLEHTHVSAKLSGFVAEVEVAQTYANPFKEPIEAVYVFPLPENSAVSHMRMVIDRRVIEADIKEREQARQIYTQAKQQGFTAALLEQERPNVFTQSVANIEPGKKIEVVVRYTQDLSYDAGAYEFVFPMVVGPRFMPGAALDRPKSGSGTKADTTRVPDASRISPPYVGKGERTGRDISLELIADPSLAVSSFEVPTHEVVSRRPADGTLRLTLAEKDSIPNRDFVLRYRVAGAQPKATLFLSGPSHGADTESGFFSLVVAPPDLDVESLVGQREIVFVVDVSGSMSGEPLSMCKTAMRDALERLRPVDTFNILTFAGQTSMAFETPQPANTANIREALAIVDELNAGGGTQMADAVATALSPRVERGRHRYVFFLTDGEVGNDAEIISATGKFVSTVKAGGQRARVFGFGVGSSVNRYLIDGLSDAGEGIAVYATNREDPLRAVNKFFHYIDRAVLENLRIDWGGMKADELYPNPMPDLFASHPVILHGRYRGRPSAPVWVHGEARGKTFDMPVLVKPQVAELSTPQVLGSLWAREKVTFLEEALGLGDPNAGAQITKLGLDFHLVTRFTSLIAVDDSKRVGDGRPKTVIEALDQPEGVDVAMAGGDDGSNHLIDEEDKDGLPDADNNLERMKPKKEEAAPAEEPAATPSAPPPEMVSDTVATLDVSRSAPRRGCGCRTVGQSSDESQYGWLGILLVAAFVARRNGRSRATPTLR